MFYPQVITETAKVFTNTSVTDRDRALAVCIISSRVALSTEKVIFRDAAGPDDCAFSLQLALANAQYAPDAATFIVREASLLDDTDKGLLNKLMTKSPLKLIITCDPSEFDEKSCQILTDATRPTKQSISAKKPKKAKPSTASNAADADAETGAGHQPVQVESEDTGLEAIADSEPVSLGFDSASSNSESPDHESPDTESTDTESTEVSSAGR